MPTAVGLLQYCTPLPDKWNGTASMRLCPHDEGRMTSLEPYGMALGRCRTRTLIISFAGTLSEQFQLNTYPLRRGTAPCILSKYIRREW